jgi:hypothetical protein
MSTAILHQQVSTNEIRQTRAGLKAIVPGYGATWSKLGTSEEIANLPKRSAVLQSQTHETGDHVVEADQLRGAVWTFEPQEDFCGVLVVMDAEVERALTGDFDFLRDVVAAGGESQAGAHAASTSSSILKLSGWSLCAPLFDGSRWGHQQNAKRISALGDSAFLASRKVWQLH